MSCMAVAPECLGVPQGAQGARHGASRVQEVSEVENRVEGIDCAS